MLLPCCCTEGVVVGVVVGVACVPLMVPCGVEWVTCSMFSFLAVAARIWSTTCWTRRSLPNSPASKITSTVTYSHIPACTHMYHTCTTHVHTCTTQPACTHMYHTAGMYTHVPHSWHVHTCTHMYHTAGVYTHVHTCTTHVHTCTTHVHTCTTQPACIE